MFVMERFNLKKKKFRKQYHIKISDRFAALENLNVSMDVNRAWEDIKENFKISAKERLGMYELKHYDPWFGEECL